MEYQKALEIINQRVAEKIDRRLSEVEIAIFTGAWEDQTYDQIAEISGYSLNYLQRDVGPKFWKLLSNALGRKLNKTNVRGILNQIAQEQEKREEQETQRAGDRKTIFPVSPQPSLTLSAFPSPLPTASSQIHTDWGEALDVSIFYGQEAELEILTRWIMHDRCRLVTLLGMGGIGKSALATRVAQQLQDQFECVIWRSLRNAPTLETLLADLVPFVSQHQDTQAKPERLLHWLRQSRCLVILDNIETLLQAGDRVGRYQDEYESYGRLFKLIGETAHQSCLLLTSREKPAEVGTLESLDAWVRTLPLKGSLETAMALISTKGLLGKSQEKRQLCDRYNCNPLALKIVANSIHSLFDGEIAPFLEQETIILDGLRRLLDEQFDRLSALEQIIMFWLAINRDWTSIAELQQDIFPSIPRIHLLEALESLSCRSLIKKRSGTYTQESVVMEYVIQRLIEKMVTDISSITLDLFHQFSLMKTTVKDSIQEMQVRLLLRPIVENLQAIFPNPTVLRSRLQRIRQNLQSDPNLATGYGAGNLLNLYCHLNFDVSGEDFSGLTIRHAGLRGVDLHHIDFSNVHFIHASFTETFGCVLGIALSPDDQWLATGDSNSDVCIRQADTGQLLASLQGHTDCVCSVAFNPNGQWLATGSQDRTIRLWDVRTRQAYQTLQGHEGWVASIDWSPDGTLLASGSTDRTVRLWDIRTGHARILSGHPDGVLSVSWHQNGQWLATGSQDSQIRVWDISTGECIQTLVGHSNQVWTIAWSPDGNWLASGSFDQTIRIWNTATWQCTRIFQNAPDPILKVSWHPAGNILASGSFNRVVKLWDPFTGQCLNTLQGHLGEVFSLAWSSNGQQLFSGSQDQMIRCWDIQTGLCVQTLQGYLNRVWSLSWSPDGQKIASTSQDHTIRLWGIQTGQCSTIFYGHRSLVQAVACHPQNQLLASSACDLAIKVWNTTTGECIKTWVGHAGWIWSIAWSPDGKVLASGSADQTVRLWDLQRGCLQVLSIAGGQAWSVTWSPDSTKLANSGGQFVYLWEAETGQCLAVLEGHTDQVIPVQWSPDGRMLASAGSDQTVRLWNATTGQCEAVFQGHTQQVFSLAWHPTGQLLASAAFDRTIRFWNIQDGSCTTVQGHTDRMTAIAFSPNGTYLAASGDDQAIHLWETQTRTLVHVLRLKRPYEGMNITGARGLSEVEKTTLKNLGAVGV